MNKKTNAGANKCMFQKLQWWINACFKNCNDGIELYIVEIFYSNDSTMI